MSAVGLSVAANEFPDNGNAINQQQRLNGSISYYYATSGDLTTLSTNNAIAGADRMGYLYVPDLSADDACNNASTTYVPKNVTRKTDLPVNFPLVAVAPWISPECTLNYLKSAQSDYNYSGALSALIFFLPNQSSSDPPPTNDPAWSLGDGGQWKKDSAFPVYAVPTWTATQVLYEMSLYSGNTSSAPFGSELRQIYGDDSFVRLWMDVNVASISGTGIPSIWVFLLIILAVLLVALGIVSGFMHLMQRRRRRALRTRIASGQIDLERLGIKAVTVPQTLIDGMPLYPYKSVEPPPHDPKQASSGVTEQTSTLPTGVHALHQPTCAICLDDFIESETNVRELPCRHIYHPECIDTFLRENSSLCPMCKKSTLPPGYIPDVQVTNNMVRRERALRRNRATASSSIRQTTDVSGGEQTGEDVPPASSNAIALEATQPPPSSSHGRREWARRRALAMLGPHHHTSSSSAANGGVITSSSQTGSSPPSRPRKLLRTVFPGIG